MGIRLQRKKKRVALLSVIYRLQRWLPMGGRAKFKLFLDLEWIFDRLAMEASFAYYPAEQHPFRKHGSAFLMRLLPEGARVLDLGCGRGDMSAVVAGKASQVVGVDHDPRAIGSARTRYTAPNLEFLHADALTYLESGPAPFDVLILSHVLEHLDGPETFLRTFAPYFRHVYIEVPDFDKTYLNHYRSELGVDLIHTDDDHVSEFDREELRTMLDDCGLRIIEAEYRFGVQRYWCAVGPPR